MMLPLLVLPLDPPDDPPLLLAPELEDSPLEDPPLLALLVVEPLDDDALVLDDEVGPGSAPTQLTMTASPTVVAAIAKDA